MNWEEFFGHELWYELMNGHYGQGILNGIRDECWLVFEDDCGHFTYVDELGIARMGVVYDN